MTPLKRIQYLEKLSIDMETSSYFIKPDLYKKDSWWRTAYERALQDLDKEDNL